MKITLTNFILIVLLLVSGCLCFLFYTNLQETKKELAEYKDIEQLKQRSEQFVQDFIYGKHKKYLTEKMLAESESRVQSDDESHGVSLIERIDIKGLFTKREENEDDQASSYAIVEVEYNTEDKEMKSDNFIQNLTLKTHWIQEDGQWKVNALEVSLLKDSRDERLRKKAREAQEKAQKQ